MGHSALISLALTSLGCTQSELAKRMNVSPSQITKWKNDEYMAGASQEKLAALIGIDPYHADFALAVGSVDVAKKWAALIKWCFQDACDCSETGYDTSEFYEFGTEFMVEDLFSTLQNMGVQMPQSYPQVLDQLDADGVHHGGDEGQDAWDATLQEFPFICLIREMFRHLNDVYGFYYAYVCDLYGDIDSVECLIAIDNIEASLLDLAACKLEATPSIAPDYAKHRHETLKMYTDWVRAVKSAAIAAGRPLRAELMDLVSESADALGVDAEAGSLGVRDNQLHPDIYMNELLEGMRVIQHFLPKILDKLGIEK